jgi:hypothetical protein
MKKPPEGGYSFFADSAPETNGALDSMKHCGD